MVDKLRKLRIHAFFSPFVVIVFVAVVVIVVVVVFITIIIIIRPLVSI